jgi:hypothetical protein
MEVVVGVMKKSCGAGGLAIADREADTAGHFFYGGLPLGDPKAAANSRADDPIYVFAFGRAWK